MQIFKCKICGHLEFEEIPEKCPVCEAPKEDFEQNDKIFIESKEKSPEAEAKHIPALTVKKECGLIPEESCTDVFIRVGKTLHPMLENHFIQFLDCYLNDRYIVRIQLTPEVLNPATCLHMKGNTGKIAVVQNCNIHGYWVSEIML